jgi:D-alanine-D-alanine ligase-like ATP-grasp enzyme
MGRNTKTSLSLRLLINYFKIRRIIRGKLGLQKTEYVWERLDYYRKMWRNGAREIGADYKELSDNTWEISLEGKLTRIAGWLVELDNPVTLNIAGNKILSYRLLEDAGLEVPPYRVFGIDNLEKVKEFMHEHKGMFVVKPAIGTASGRGVTTHIQNYKDARKAAALAAGYGSEKLLIEKLIPGEVYRLLYVGGELLFASRRNGIWLKGDGRSTIEELIATENRSRLPKKKDAASPISYDLDMKATLDVQGLTLKSVIDADRRVLTKSIDNKVTDKEEIRTVYDENVTHLIGSQLREEGAKAARAVRSDFLGVDIITRDMTVGLAEGGGIVGEVNTTPGMHHHINLKNSEQTPSAVQHVLRYLLENSKPQ